MPLRHTLRPGTNVVIAGLLGLTAISVVAGSAASLAVSSQSLSTFSTCTLTANIPTTGLVADAYVSQASPDQNAGTEVRSRVTSRNGGRNERTYVRFDLSACVPVIRASSTVRLATLRLYLTAIPNGCRTLDIFLVTGAWTEGQVTWNNQPLGTVTNDPPTAARTDSFDAGSQSGCEHQATNTYIVGADVTTDAASNISGGASDIGWMIRDDAEDAGPARTVEFASKEAGVLARAPQLVVTYVNAP